MNSALKITASPSLTSSNVSKKYAPEVFQIPSGIVVEPSGLNGLSDPGGPLILFTSSWSSCSSSEASGEATGEPGADAVVLVDLLDLIKRGALATGEPAVEPPPEPPPEL